jgi:GntR family transcriptional repressor for pyruvate dehydrogenase complex
MNKLKINTNKVTLVDQVEDILLNYFKRNELRPGNSIPNEYELAEALGVGRGVLREALSRLRMLGLIESRPKKGMTLSEPPILGGMKKVIDPRILGDEALFNLLGLRIALEIGITGMIFQNLNSEYINELEEIVNRGVIYNNNEYLPQSEYEFHAKLYEITGNNTIIEFQKILHPISNFVKDKFSILFQPINLEYKSSERVKPTHKDLFDLIKKRDKNGFQVAVEEHFAVYNEFLKRNESKKETVSY